MVAYIIGRLSIYYSNMECVRCSAQGSDQQAKHITTLATYNTTKTHLLLRP